MQKGVNDMNRHESKNMTPPSRGIDPLQEFYRRRFQMGLRSSCKRSLVVEYFIEKDRHYTVEELYDEVKKVNPKVSLSTVYRTLKLLSDCGLASACNFGDGVIRFEPVHTAQHHDHLICVKCGRIIEFKNDRIEKIQKDVAKKYTFSISSHRMELYGLCDGCQKKKGRK